MIPEQIARRLDEQRRPSPRADRPISRGDLRRAVSGGESRLVLVLDVNTVLENAQVTLVHPYPEYATGSDIVIDPSVSEVAYPVVVQTGLRGVVWLKDLGRLVSRLPMAVVDASLSPRTVPVTGEGISAGTTFEGPLDARADFKASERNSLARLCADCTGTVLDGEPFEFEVDAVFHALLAPSPDSGRMMEAIVDLCATRRHDIVFTLEHVEFLDSKGLLDYERWSAALGADGLAFRLGPLQVLIDRAMSRFGHDEAVPRSTVNERQLVAAARHE